MAKIKGFAIRGLLRYLKEKHPGRTAEVLKHLDPSVSANFDRPIVLSQWYPYEAFANLLRTIDRELGNGDLKLCVDIGQYAAAQDLRGIFKMMVSILDPDTLLKRSAVFWAKYSDTGKFSHVPKQGKTYSVKLEGFPEMDEAHCFLMNGWMTALGLMSKARDVKMFHTSCVSHHGAMCVWEGSWTDA